VFCFWEKEKIAVTDSIELDTPTIAREAPANLDGRWNSQFGTL
jgi:hypothetical protein